MPLMTIQNWLKAMPCPADRTPFSNQTVHEIDQIETQLGSHDPEGFLHMGPLKPGQGGNPMGQIIGLTQQIWFFIEDTHLPRVSPNQFPVANTICQSHDEHERTLLQLGGGFVE